MPLVPLYRTDVPDPDASHDVRSPGGYEWWYFDAEDSTNNRQIVGIWLNGFVFHPGYLRAYRRYMERPTKHRPPAPNEYACVYFVVYEGGRVVRQFITQYPSSEVETATLAPDVRIGPNRMNARPDGAFHLRLEGTPWKLALGGPMLREDETLGAELEFRPLFQHSPMERIFFSRATTSAEHRWIISRPLCKVEGRVWFDGEEFAFRGRGYHDHNYGSAPIGQGVKRWLWGRILTEDRAATFHLAVPSDRDRPDEAQAIVVDASGMRELAIDRRDIADWSGVSRLMLRYPMRVDFGHGLSLHSPRVIDSSPFYMRLLYETPWGGGARALCEVAYPHRLRWPILGRMIETSIDVRPIRAGSSERATE
jgi:carotenoid 1,2-hydratase